MKINEAIQQLIQQVKIDSGSELTDQMQKYVLINELTSIQNKLLKNMNEEETSGVVKSTNQNEVNTIDTLTVQQKQTFIEMLDGIADQAFLENDRLGWLLTSVLTEYYAKTVGFNIDHWMYNVNGEVQLKLILLLMSQAVDFGEENRFPDLKFLINRYKEEQEGNEQ